MSLPISLIGRGSVRGNEFWLVQLELVVQSLQFYPNSLLLAPGTLLHTRCDVIRISRDKATCVNDHCGQDEASINMTAKRLLPCFFLCLAPCVADLEQEYELLAVIIEALTVTASHSGKEKHLRNRAWAGRSHVGCRPQQYQSYYNLIRAHKPRSICEIGFNGGHSAAVFLSAAGRAARLYSFDLGEFTYTRAQVRILNKLFPGQIDYYEGNSTQTLPSFIDSHRIKGNARPCDIFSVDGSHSYEGAKADIVNAISATRAGGVLVLDDQQSHSEPRRAFNEISKAGWFSDIRCTGNMFNISYVNRYDASKVRHQEMTWCFAVLAK